MNIIVGSVMKAELIKETILAIESIPFTYVGKRGMNMIFSCESKDEKQTLRFVKDKLKEIPELGGLFYNVSID